MNQFFSFSAILTSGFCSTKSSLLVTFAMLLIDTFCHDKKTLKLSRFLCNQISPIFRTLVFPNQTKQGLGIPGYGITGRGIPELPEPSLYGSSEFEKLEVLTRTQKLKTDLTHVPGIMTHISARAWICTHGYEGHNLQHTMYEQNIKDFCVFFSFWFHCSVRFLLYD